MKKQFFLNFYEMNFVQYYTVESFYDFILLMLFYNSIFQHDALLFSLRFEKLIDVFISLIKADLMYAVNILKNDYIVRSLFQDNHDFVLMF